MTTPPESVELTAALFIERARRDELPREFIFLAARGFLPLPQEDLVAVLAFLASANDPELVAAAKESLADQPTRAILGFTQDPDANPEWLDFLARATDDPIILEAILRSRQTTDETVALLAAKVGEPLQEIIVINHERLIRSPAVLEALESNPRLGADVRRRITEVREEYFDKKRIEEVRIGEDPYALTAEEEAQFADLLALANETPEEAAATLKDTAAPASDDEEGLSAWGRIQKMNVSERVRCALKGGKTERTILIKDRNKLVCSAVIKSPRITESEIESYAGMRSIEDEALRLIGTNRDWMSKYPIMTALVRNPKAPIGVVLPLINRLTLKDLKSLSSDKGVSEAVRATARKLYGARKQS